MTGRFVYCIIAMMVRTMLAVVLVAKLGDRGRGSNDETKN
jgi:hypothetical protein